MEQGKIQNKWLYQLEKKDDNEYLVFCDISRQSIDPLTCSVTHIVIEKNKEINILHSETVYIKYLKEKGIYIELENKIKELIEHYQCTVMVEDMLGKIKSYGR